MWRCGLVASVQAVPALGEQEGASERGFLEDLGLEAGSQ